MRTTWLALAAAAIPAITALSTAEILSVFTTSSNDLTGASVVLPSYTLSVVTNTTHALFSLNNTNSRPFQVGWMATAVGPAMTTPGSDFLIAASNPATATGPALIPWTLSHRLAQGENMPMLAGTTPQTATANYYTFLPALSTLDPASTYTVVSYLRLLTMPDSYPNPSAFKSISRTRTQFMYASSTIPPGSNQENAILTQHDQPHATVMLDLSTPIVLAGAVGPASSSSAAATRGAASPTVAAVGSTAAAASATAATAADPLAATVLGRSKRDMILIAHAVIASLGLILFTPAAILVARYFRGFSWFPIHAALQLLAATFVIISFALGYTQVNGPHFFDSHTRVGLGLLILVLAQVTLGALAHRVPSGTPSVNARLPTLSNKPAVRLVHIIAGIFITGLGLAQVRLGIEEYPEFSDGGENVPVGVIVVYWIIVAGIVISYLFGWVRDNKGVKKQEGPKIIEEKVGVDEPRSQF